MANGLRDSGPDPEQLAIERQSRQMVARAVASLTPRQRLVIIMRYREGKTFRAIAAAIGVTDVAVVGIHSRACESLRRSLSPLLNLP